MVELADVWPDPPVSEVGRLPRLDEEQGVPEGTGGPPARARQAPGVDPGRGPAGGRAVRGPRCGRQGRRHQDAVAESQPADLPGRRARDADRARAEPVVFPALRRAAAGRRRDGPVRPELVQPGRRRARHGLLHGRRVPRVLPRPARSSSGCSSGPGSSSSSTGSRSATPSRSGGSRAASTTRPSAGSCRRWTSSRGPAGSSTRWRRTRCSPTPTSRARPGTSSTPTTRSAPG